MQRGYIDGERKNGLGDGFQIGDTDGKQPFCPLGQAYQAARNQLLFVFEVEKGKRLVEQRMTWVNNRHRFRGCKCCSF